MARAGEVAGMVLVDRRRPRRVTTLVAAWAVMAFGLVAAAPTVNAQTVYGAVYTQTNTPQNSVQVYHRDFNGNLTTGPTVPTGGAGSLENPPLGIPILDSAGSVTLHRSGRVLLVVNAGSDTITSFLVRPDYSLQFASQVPSNGDLPVSVTTSGFLAYVVNSLSGNISGYNVNLVTGQLTHIPGSTRSLAAPGAPAHISFDTFGRVLTVTERTTNVIETFALGFDNRPGRPMVNHSTGDTPFGLAYTWRNQAIVSNAAEDIEGESSVSSYGVSLGGTVTPIDHDPTGETAACWVVITLDNRFAFVTNALSFSITRLGLGIDGRMTVLGRVEAGGVALDAGLSRDGRTLYVLTQPLDLPPFTAAQVNAWRVNAIDGTLSFIGSSPRNLPGSASGLAAL